MFSGTRWLRAAATANGVRTLSECSSSPKELKAFAQSVRSVANNNSTGRVSSGCALTKTESVEDWTSHVLSPRFRVRHALLRRCKKQPFPVQDLWKQVSAGQKLIDEFNCRGDARRLERLTTALRFLSIHNVLLHSIFRYHEEQKSWNVTKEFGRIALVGETFLRAECHRRFAAAVPGADGRLLKELCDETISLDKLAAMFHDLHLNSTLPPQVRRKQKLSEKQRTAMVFAILGELHWFVAKTKATDRTHNNALFPPSDVLVLHVLAAHCLEAIMGFLVYNALKPAMEDVRDVWANYYTSLPQQAHRPGAVSSHLSLHIEPVDRKTGQLVSMLGVEEEEGQKELSSVKKDEEGLSQGSAADRVEASSEETPAEGTSENGDLQGEAEGEGGEKKKKKKVMEKPRVRKTQFRRERPPPTAPTTAELTPLHQQPLHGSFLSQCQPTVHWKRFHSAIDLYEKNENREKLPEPMSLSAEATSRK